MLDRLLAGNLTLAGQLHALAGDFTVTGLRVAGQHAAFTADGGIGRQSSDLRLALALPDLRRADPRLSGRGDVTAQITGPQDRLDATARIAVANATALARPIPRLAIDAVIRDLQGALDTRLTLAGEIDAKPATGTVQLARLPDDSWNLSTLDLAIGSVRLNGALTLDPASRAAGRLTLAARNLDDLSPLALTKLGGQLDADIALALVEGRQNLALTARGARLAGPSVAIDRLDATAAANDLYGRPTLDAAIAIDRAVVSGEAISAIRFDSKGAAEASAFTLERCGARIRPERGRKARARRALAAGDRLLRRAPRRPPDHARQPGLAQLPGLAASRSRISRLAIDNGRLTSTGAPARRSTCASPPATCRFRLRASVAPRLDLAGTLNAQAQVQGRPDALSGPWSVRIARLATPETRQRRPAADRDHRQGRLQGPGRPASRPR